MGSEQESNTPQQNRRAARAAARAAVKEATRVLQYIAARAKEEGITGQADVQRLKSLLHGARPNRLKTPEEFHAHAKSMHGFAQYLASRMLDGESLLEAALHDTEATRSVSKRRRPPRRRPTGIKILAATPGSGEVESEGRQPPDSPSEAKDCTSDRAPRRDFLLDELDDEQREQVAQRRELMLLMDGGSKWQAALEQLGLDYSRRWVFKLRARWNEHGVLGLYDRRWGGGAPVTMPAQVQDRTIYWYKERRGAGPKAIWDQVRDDCKKEGWREPSYEWVKKYLFHLPRAFKIARNKGMRELERQAAPVADYDPTTFANEAWQVDHCRADIWVRVLKRDGQWVVSEVWVTAVVDIHSRAIMAVIISTTAPNAWTSAMAIRAAILPKHREGWPMRGKPLMVVTDHGKDLKAKSVVSSIRALGIRFELCPERYPNMKGEVERWFGTFQSGQLVKFPGYKKPWTKSAAAATKLVAELFTPEELKEELERWIVSVYHQRMHETLSEGPVDRSPAQVWEQTVRLEEVDSAQLDVLMLKSDKVRTVTNKGIKLKLKHTGRMRFWSPALADKVGARVLLRYNPHDFQSVLVYRAETGERLCEAWRMGIRGARYTGKDMVQARKQLKKGVAARLAAVEERRQKDINHAPDAWNQANQLIEGRERPRSVDRAKLTSEARHVSKAESDRPGPVGKAPKSKPVRRSRKPASVPDADVLSLLEAMERKDRGIA